MIIKLMFFSLSFMGFFLLSNACNYFIFFMGSEVMFLGVLFFSIQKSNKLILYVSPQTLGSFFMLGGSVSMNGMFSIGLSMKLGFSPFFIWIYSFYPNFPPTIFFALSGPFKLYLLLGVGFVNDYFIFCFLFGLLFFKSFFQIHFFLKKKDLSLNIIYLISGVLDSCLFASMFFSVGFFAYFFLMVTYFVMLMIYICLVNSFSVFNSTSFWLSTLSFPPSLGFLSKLMFLFCLQQSVINKISLLSSILVIMFSLAQSLSYFYISFKLWGNMEESLTPIYSFEITTMICCIFFFMTVICF